MQRKPSLHLIPVRLGSLLLALRLGLRGDDSLHRASEERYEGEMASREDGAGNVPFGDVGRLERGVIAKPAGNERAAKGGGDGERGDEETTWFYLFHRKHVRENLSCSCVGEESLPLPPRTWTVAFQPMPSPAGRRTGKQDIGTARAQL